jgi:hypothetical protein
VVRLKKITRAKRELFINIEKFGTPYPKKEFFRVLDLSIPENLDFRKIKEKRKKKKRNLISP